MPGRRKESAAQSALAADAVLAYVRDEEPAVLNITDAAVAADPLFAALHLTAFAGRAIRLLAESLGVPAEAAVALVRDRDHARMADKVLRMSYDPVADAGYFTWSTPSLPVTSLPPRCLIILSTELRSTSTSTQTTCFSGSSCWV